MFCDEFIFQKKYIILKNQRSEPVYQDWLNRTETLGNIINNWKYFCNCFFLERRREGATWNNLGEEHLPLFLEDSKKSSIFYLVRSMNKKI